MAALFDFSEADLTLEEAIEYLTALRVEHWDDTKVAEAAQFFLDATETE